MAQITIPAIKAPTMNLQLLRGDTSLQFFSGAEVIAESNLALWLMSFPLVVVKIAEARAWWSALSQLTKLSNHMLIPPVAWQRLSTSSATGLVQGAGQLGNSVIVDGVASSALIVAEGDFFSFDTNKEFKVATADATSVGTTVTINFEPAMRVAPINNELVHFASPVMKMRLVTPVMQYAASMPDFWNTSLNLIETFGP